MTDLKTFIEFIAKALVDNPEEVKIKETQGDRSSIFELSVNAKDHGKIIGKHGKTVNSIRTILSAVAAKQGRRAVLELPD